jgi:hypothetical protein
VIVFLDNGNDIEKQLIKDGYQDEIKKALIARGEYHNEQHKVKKETEIKAYGDDKIYELITGAKTQFAPVIVISCPALLVKVKASTFLLLRDNKTRIRSVSTRVLPLPALALTYKAPSSISTIDCCVCESIICLLMMPPQ